MKRTNVNKHGIKSLINAFRIVSKSTDDLAACFARVKDMLEVSIGEADSDAAAACCKSDAQIAGKVLDAVIADMRAEDAAAKKTAE